MLSFGSATGNLFNRLGAIGGAVKEVQAYQAAQLTNLTNTTYGITAQYNAESDLQAEIGNSYIGLLNTAGSSVGSVAQQLAVDTINRMVFRDNPRINQTLSSQNTLASIQEVIRQMGLAGATVLAMTVTGTPSTFTGAGNGIINVSTKRPLDGRTLENSFSESLLLTVTQDSYTGGAVAGNEQLTLTGTGLQSNVFAFDWPLGSNATTTFNAIDGDINNSSGNLLTNSGFSSWSGNTPSNYTIVTGVAGTNFARETTIVYGGSGSSLQIIGDGSTLVQIRQQFNSSTGTTATLDPLTQYGVNIFIRRDGTIPGAGLLNFELVDQNLAVINDMAGTPNSFQIDLTALNTQFASYTGVIRTPTIMPSSYSWQLRMPVGNALTTGRSVYLDKISLGQMTQAYTSGPFLCCHSGDNNFVTGDYGTCTISNSRGAGGTLSTFQTLLCQLLYQYVITNEIIFPSSPTPSVSDNLIQ